MAPSPELSGATTENSKGQTNQTPDRGTGMCISAWNAKPVGVETGFQGVPFCLMSDPFKQLNGFSPNLSSILKASL